MESRQEKLLFLVIETYIKTAEPIGSKFLVEKAGLDWSEATVRNELRALEDDGYLSHPHTSAGRVPTTKGYEHYLRVLNLGSSVPSHSMASRKDNDLLQEAFSAYNDFEQAMKNVAKTLVEVSDETVLIAFSPDKIYYTGLANLFEKPDFEEMKQVATVSEALDNCDECLPEFIERVKNEPGFYLGNAHPFGSMLSVVASRFGEDNKSLIVLIGPQRMNYKKNWSLVHKIIEII